MINFFRRFFSKKIDVKEITDVYILSAKQAAEKIEEERKKNYSQTIGNLLKEINKDIENKIKDNKRSVYLGDFDSHPYLKDDVLQILRQSGYSIRKGTIGYYISW
jgi:hypothetical protein